MIPQNICVFRREAKFHRFQFSLRNFIDFSILPKSPFRQIRNFAITRYTKGKISPYRQNLAELESISRNFVEFHIGHERSNQFLMESWQEIVFVPNLQNHNLSKLKFSLNTKPFNCMYCKDFHVIMCNDKLYQGHNKHCLLLRTGHTPVCLQRFKCQLIKF